MNISALIQAAGVQGWANARRDKYRYELGRDDPGVLCLPLGPRTTMAYGFAAKMLHTPGLLVILYEDLTYGQIFLDGRALPTDPNPSWMGSSVGRRDGDALVVTSTGYNDRSLLDFDGHPHSESLRITERIERCDFGHMDVQITLEDPKVVAKPVTIPMHADLVADTELLEYVCQENKRSRPRLVGTTDDDKKLKVAGAAEVLSRYVGVYSLAMPEGPPRRMKVLPGFLAEGVAVAFFPGASGVVSELVVTIVEGDLKGVRIPDGR